MSYNLCTIPPVPGRTMTDCCCRRERVVSLRRCLCAGAVPVAVHPGGRPPRQRRRGCGTGARVAPRQRRRAVPASATAASGADISRAAAGSTPGAGRGRARHDHRPLSLHRYPQCYRRHRRRLRPWCSARRARSRGGSMQQGCGCGARRPPSTPASCACTAAGWYARRAGRSATPDRADVTNGQGAARTELAG